MYGRNTFYRTQPGRSYYTGPRRGQSFGGVTVPPMLDFAARQWVAFKEVQPVRAAWIEAKASSFEFAASMHNAVVRFGDLTEKQGAAVDRCAARDAERASQRAANGQQGASAPALVLAVQNIRDALQARGKAKIMLVGFQFSLAPATGSNPGALYVKHNGTYIGKIAQGSDVFQPGRDFDRATFPALQAACQDPAGAVRAHAEETARRLAEAQAAGLPLSLPCGCCGLTLTDPVSVARGIGPICAGRWGF